jgi:hypothetical protein
MGATRGLTGNNISQIEELKKEVTWLRESQSINRATIEEHRVVIANCRRNIKALFDFLATTDQFNFYLNEERGKERDRANVKSLLKEVDNGDEPL